jgi:hypothetical protein
MGPCEPRQKLSIHIPGPCEGLAALLPALGPCDVVSSDPNWFYGPHRYIGQEILSREWTRVSPSTEAMHAHDGPMRGFRSAALLPTLGQRDVIGSEPNWFYGPMWLYGQRDHK